ncbi:MAG TPA: PqqD family protein [Candidatus Elarobacter sp.]|jgi:hypothetical protein|nr:PqqD family protein [Candidatus Elarobacter sp.]
MLPLSRTEKLLVEELDEDLVIYDEERHKAHRLNGTAAFVWRRCDGRTTVAQIAALLAAKTGDAVGDDVVLLALRQLQSASLLRANGRTAARPVGIPRRELLKTAALFAVVLPAVTTILVPTPAQAASPATPTATPKPTATPTPTPTPKPPAAGVWCVGVVNTMEGVNPDGVVGPTATTPGSTVCIPCPASGTCKTPMELRWRRGPTAGTCIIIVTVKPGACAACPAGGIRLLPPVGTNGGWYVV